jgi:hypothetical protein
MFLGVAELFSCPDDLSKAAKSRNEKFLLDEFETEAIVLVWSLDIAGLNEAKFDKMCDP